MARFSALSVMAGLVPAIYAEPQAWLSGLN